MRPRRWFDPEQNHLFERISYHETAVKAIEGSDALFISTDWEEFRSLATTIRQAVKPPYLIIDGRRMIPNPDALVERGYQYLAVGSMLNAPDSIETKSENGALAGETVADIVAK